MEDKASFSAKEGPSTMKATRFMRKPFIVTGYKITEEDMDAIARWCGGHIIEPSTEDRRRFIRVPVIRYMNVKQTEGHVGMWVILSMQRGQESFKIFTDESLEKTFIAIPRESEDDERHFIAGEDTQDLSAAREKILMPNNVHHLPVQKSNADPLHPFQSTPHN